MPRWNIWHSGAERVIFPVGKKERVRYRRTALDLNLSGNLLAWHRTKLAFERLGKDFRALSSRTVKELEKGLKRAMDRQGRPPGDWTINEKADSLLEAALRDLGKVAEVDAGFREFVENEEKRYRDGVAGREPKETRKLLALLRDQESVVDAIKRLKRADEIIEIEESLKPHEGESLADAAARVVKQTQVLATERDALKDQNAEATKVISEVRDELEPDPEKSLVAAAKRLAERAKEAEFLNKRLATLKTEANEILTENKTLTDEVGELKGQLGSEQEKVHRLEEEIVPLRRLRERVQELLSQLMTSPLAQKFESGLNSLLGEVGKLVGIPCPAKEKVATPDSEPGN